MVGREIRQSLIHKHYRLFHSRAKSREAVSAVNIIKTGRDEWWDIFSQWRHLMLGSKLHPKLAKLDFLFLFYMGFF